MEPTDLEDWLGLVTNYNNKLLMRRGRRIFDKMIDDSPVPSSIEKKRGRSIDKINRRNVCLAYRYYYHAKICRLRFEDVMKELSKEFFLEHRTISNIIQADQNLLSRVVHEKPEVKHLSKEYSFFIG